MGVHVLLCACSYVMWALLSGMRRQVFVKDCYKRQMNICTFHM